VQYYGRRIKISFNPLVAAASLKPVIISAINVKAA
jgi:hypothetical protein